jgi:hypothetical protein
MTTHHDGPLADRLPAREPADHQAAVGAVAGLAAGATMWLVAMLFARGDMGFFFPLRLVAASFMGLAALDTGAALGPLLLGILLVALTSVVFGLVFTSILSERHDVFGSVLVGILYAGTLWLVSWFVIARVVDPMLFAAASALYMLLLHLVYGVVLGFLVPFLRKVLP